MIDQIPLLFSVMEWGEFGQKRYTATLAAGETRRIPLIVPAGSWWLVFRYRFGNITANNINFYFDGIRNYFEEPVNIGNELINFTTWCCPFLAVSNSSGSIVVNNTAATAQNFEILLDFVVINSEIAGKIREFFIGKREEYKEKFAYKESLA